jgi:hypothetical protein
MRGGRGVIAIRALLLSCSRIRIIRVQSVFHPWRHSRSAPNGSAGSTIAPESCAMAPSCPPGSRRSTSCFWSFAAIPVCDSTTRWDSTSTAPKSAFRHANGAWPSWRLAPCAVNGSTDGTGLYLAGARDLAAVPVTVVFNATNVGFPAAINQGSISLAGNTSCC